MEKCSNCGGTLQFEPSIQKLKCVKCNYEQNIDFSYDYSRHRFEMSSVTKEDDFVSNILQMHCPNCGAIFKCSSDNMSSTCEYCGSNLVVDFMNDNVAPDACATYSFDKNQAGEYFRKGLKRKWFVPNKFKKSPPKSEIESVYVPAYLFNLDTNNRYKGRIYIDSSDRNGASREYRNISGTQSVYIKDVAMECSSQMTQTVFNQIEPFDFGNLYKFTPEFLMGYSVEYYDKKIEELKVELDKFAKNRIKQDILKGYHYTGVSYLNIDTTYTKGEYSKIILPTYKVTYKYKNKNYSTFMNGQTGKVGGNVPRSKWKIGLLVISICAVVAGLALLVVSAVTTANNNFNIF